MKRNEMTLVNEEITVSANKHSRFLVILGCAVIWMIWKCERAYLTKVCEISLLGYPPKL